MVSLHSYPKKWALCATTAEVVLFFVLLGRTIFYFFKDESGLNENGIVGWLNNFLIVAETVTTSPAVNAEQAVCISARMRPSSAASVFFLLQDHPTTAWFFFPSKQAWQKQVKENFSSFARCNLLY